MGEENKSQAQKSAPDQASMDVSEQKQTAQQNLPKKLERATRHYERQGFDHDWDRH